jgi:hypothetical protein
VCLAFARALQRYGVPEEVLTDNGKQFTARFGRGGEVLFDLLLPAALMALPAPVANAHRSEPEPAPVPPPQPPVVTPGAVEFDRVVSGSGNMFVADRQFLFGPARAGPGSLSHSGQTTT